VNPTTANQLFTTIVACFAKQSETHNDFLRDDVSVLSLSFLPPTTFLYQSHPSLKSTLSYGDQFHHRITFNIQANTQSPGKSFVSSI